jgi:GMP synthase (glutamine-hydrolysing)
MAVIKTGRTYHDLVRQCGDFEDWTARGLGVPSPSVAIIDVGAGRPLPHPGDIAGAVITGSHSMVTDGQSWVEPLAEWLRSLVEEEIPVLGVCYGHQLLGHALGARVGYHPDGPEIGTVEVDLLPEGERDPLLGGMPRRFHAHTTHAQSVLTLPDGAVLLARTDHDAHAAFRAGSCAWGVQFHPEYDEQIMRHYVREQRETLQALGRDPDRVEGEVRFADTRRILRRFAELSSRR